jgi:catechol 2,3-dioxygenase-like lactoylglutathione lyase family enzyme
MDMKLELIALPVSNVDKSLNFYVNKAGFHLDHDHKVNDSLRFIQLTPTGSACSITIGNGIATDMEPGSVKGLQMVVADAKAAYDELTSRGVEATEPESMPWGTFVYFSDPDGNKWALQQLPPRP